MAIETIPKPTDSDESERKALPRRPPRTLGYLLVAFRHFSTMSFAILLRGATLIRLPLAQARTSVRS